MASGTDERTLTDRALRVIPGGVNSPVRAFHGVGREPVFAECGWGPYLWDTDGKRYIDHLMCWGAVMLGHAFGPARCAAERALRRGSGFGLSTSGEAELAEIIVDALPSIEKVRFVNSGTEAVMSAVRLARGFTGRNKVVVFEGGYHGHSDGLLARAGSGLATLGLPGSAGVPAALTAETIVARYNDLESVDEAFRAHAGDVACVLVEPVAGNMGVVAPAPGFLEGLRDACDRAGALLILDEVITGFRVAWGGAQGLFGVRPDITTLGKIIGGGLPVGAFGGRAEIMDRLAPGGDVYQAGTLSGNPVVMAAGAAVLHALRDRDPYDEVHAAGLRAGKAITAAAEDKGLPVWVGRVGPMFTVFFTEGPVRDYRSAREADPALYARFFGRLLDLGVLFPPSQWESAFISECHLQGRTLDDSLAFIADAIRSL